MMTLKDKIIKYYGYWRGIHAVSFADGLIDIIDKEPTGLVIVLNCQYCNGHGKVFSGSNIPCDVCGDTGKIKRPMKQREVIEFAVGVLKNGHYNVSTMNNVELDK